MVKSFMKKSCLVGAGVVGIVSASHAAVDLTTFAVDTASVDTLGLIVLTGLGIMWGLRKLIKTINRS